MHRGVMGSVPVWNLEITPQWIRQSSPSVCLRLFLAAGNICYLDLTDIVWGFFRHKVISVSCQEKFGKDCCCLQIHLFWIERFFYIKRKKIRFTFSSGLLWRESFCGAAGWEHHWCDVRGASYKPARFREIPEIYDNFGNKYLTMVSFCSAGVLLSSCVINFLKWSFKSPVLCSVITERHMTQSTYLQRWFYIVPARFCSRWTHGHWTVFVIDLPVPVVAPPVFSPPTDLTHLHPG